MPGRTRLLKHVLLLAITLPFFTRGAEWVEPKDGLFTEDQLMRCIATVKDTMDYIKAAGKAIEGSKTTIGAVSAIGDVDKKMAAIYEKHGLTKREHEWLSSQVLGGIGMLYLESAVIKGEADMAEQVKKNAEDQAAASNKIKAYQAALNNGSRVLTDEQRADLIKQAKDQQTAAEEEAKGHAEEAKTAADEAAKSEASAKEIDALAKKPPADVEADAKADFIKGKIEEAANIRANEKEALERQKEAKKLEAESRAKAAGFAKQAAHPEIPITPDDIEQVKKDAKQGVEDATAELQTLVQAGGIIKDAAAQMEKQRAEMAKNCKPENFALIKKHQDEIRTAWGMKKE